MFALHLLMVTEHWPAVVSVFGYPLFCQYVLFRVIEDPHVVNNTINMISSI